MKNIVYAAFFLALAFLSNRSHAYTLIRCSDNRVIKWQNATQNMAAANVSFPVGAWRTALANSLGRWNQNPSRFRFTLTYTNTVGLQNGANEVFFTNDNAILGGSPAITLWWFTCGTTPAFSEMDVAFDNRVTYTTVENQRTLLLGYGGTWRPFQTTAMHEFGHAAGLYHTNNLYSLMGEDWNHIHANSNVVRAYAGVDASRGVEFLYGLTAGYVEDFGVSHWQYRGASGEYSQHQRTSICQRRPRPGPRPGPFPICLPTTSETVGGEQRYLLNRGGTYYARFTLENNGKTPQRADVGIYLSTNDLISTADRRLTNYHGLTINHQTPQVHALRFVLPPDLAAGQPYWIGVIIDDANRVPETVEGNNATFTAIRAL